jgi:lysophospholipase L1-like esterase
LRRALVATASVALALLSAEIAVRAHVHGSVMLGLRSLHDTHAIGTVSKADAPFVPHPELGYTLNPRSQGVNTLGFKGPEPGEWGALEGRTVLLIGDSISFDEGGFADLLATELLSSATQSRVLINASIPGFTTHQERVLLEKLAPLRATTVVLQYCLNDNHEFLHRITRDGTTLLTPEAKRVLLPMEDGWWGRFVRWSYVGVEIQRVRLRRLARVSGSTFPWDDREDFCTAWRSSSWARQQRELEQMQSTVRAWGGRLLVVVIPIEDQLDGGLLGLDRDYVLFPQRQLEAICRAAGIDVIDMHAEFFKRSATGARLFRDGLHLTPVGHALVAESLKHVLQTP